MRSASWRSVGYSPGAAFGTSGCGTALLLKWTAVTLSGVYGVELWKRTADATTALGRALGRANLGATDAILVNERCIMVVGRTYGGTGRHGEGWGGHGKVTYDQKIHVGRGKRLPNENTSCMQQTWSGQLAVQQSEGSECWEVGAHQSMDGN